MGSDRSMSPRGRSNGQRRERISVLVRNLPLDTRADEIRDMMEKFGRIRDTHSVQKGLDLWNSWTREMQKMQSMSWMGLDLGGES
eukprot:jgi/Picsp_1/6712/NSC_04054-R1_---NA---